MWDILLNCHPFYVSYGLSSEAFSSSGREHVCRLYCVLFIPGSYLSCELGRGQSFGLDDSCGPGCYREDAHSPCLPRGTRTQKRLTIEGCTKEPKTDLIFTLICGKRSLGYWHRRYLIGKGVWELILSFFLWHLLHLSGSMATDREGQNFISVGRQREGDQRLWTGRGGGKSFWSSGAGKEDQGNSMRSATGRPACQNDQPCLPPWSTHWSGWMSGILALLNWSR